MPKLERRAKKWSPVFRKTGATHEKPTASFDAVGPAFLHRPISGISFTAVESGAKWLAGGALAWAPEPLLNLGWRRRSVLYDYDGENGLTPRGAIESSWAGRTRVKANEAPSDDLPVEIVLPPSLIFETSIDLPEAARATADKTIALRLGELSPIPPEDAAFAVGETRKTGAGRISVNVAIVRKSTLRAAGASLRDRPIATIGANAGADGRMEYVFRDKNSNSDAVKKWIFAAGALWASSLILLGAMEARADRALAAADARISELRQDLRMLQETKEIYARLQEVDMATFSIGDAYAISTENLRALPEGAVVTRLRLENGALNISGLVPQDAETPATVSRRAAGTVPGYHRFELTEPMAQTDEKGAAS